MPSARFGSFALGLALVGMLGLLALPLVLDSGDGGGFPDPASPSTSPPTPPLTIPTGSDPAPPDGPPSEPWTVHLEAWATRGPRGPTPDPIDRRIFGTNVWMSGGWYPKTNDTWVLMLKAIKPGVLRWPSGHPSQSWCWEKEPGVKWPGCEGTIIKRDQFDRFVAISREVGATPLVGINIKRAPPEMAAATVHYLNVEKKYGVRWFELGNEPDLGYKYDQVKWTTDNWKRYASAMKGVDPSIKVVGPVFMTGIHVWGSNGKPDLVRPFLQANSGHVDAVSWHLYPLDSENKRPTSPASPSVEHLLQYWTDDWPPSGVRFVDLATQKLRRDVAELSPGAEIWVTELGPDSGDPGAKGVTDGQAGAVWFADVLGRFAQSGTHAVMQFAYDHWSAKDELSLVKRPPAGHYDPLPPWYTYWLYAEHWGNRMVKTQSSDDGNVSVFASLRPDGKIAVVMINKGSAPVAARLTLHDHGRVADADAYVLSAPSVTSLDADVNGHKVDPRRFEETTRAVKPVEGPRSADAVWQLKPHSATFVVLTRA